MRIPTMYSNADPMGSLASLLAVPECYQEMFWKSAARSELETTALPSHVIYRYVSYMMHPTLHFLHPGGFQKS